MAYVKTVPHQKYEARAHEYVNEKFKQIFLLFVVHYQSPCKISYESKFDVLYTPEYLIYRVYTSQAYPVIGMDCVCLHR